MAETFSPDKLVFLDVLPSAAEFYGLYWNKRPFVVRGAVPRDILAGLINADELAGLTMEEGPQSRMVLTSGDHAAWSCLYGPFTEDDFSAAGDQDWTLLVQNVEQFHPDTAALLPLFTFAPRWMMDDIMVSFSAPGGSVGPHRDSYHVFLVQGQGKRRWKISRGTIKDATYVDNDELKILATGINGDEIDVTSGDVLYIPPEFGHEGLTLEPALTFSVGFLGPKLSDLYSAYGQYLAENENLDGRYVGEGLNPDSAGFSISRPAAEDIGARMSDALGTLDFTRWLSEFFTNSSLEDFGNFEARENTQTIDAFKTKLQNGASLIKPPYVKFALTPTGSGAFCLGVEGQSFILDQTLLPVIQKLMQEQKITFKSNPECIENRACLELFHQFYDHQVLEHV